MWWRAGAWLWVRSCQAGEARRSAPCHVAVCVPILAESSSDHRGGQHLSTSDVWVSQVVWLQGWVCASVSVWQLHEYSVLFEVRQNKSREEKTRGGNNGADHILTLGNAPLSPCHREVKTVKGALQVQVYKLMGDILGCRFNEGGHIWGISKKPWFLALINSTLLIVTISIQSLFIILWSFCISAIVLWYFVVDLDHFVVFLFSLCSCFVSLCSHFASLRGCSASLVGHFTALCSGFTFLLGCLIVFATRNVNSHFIQRFKY